jgi:hypothetical protein
MTTTPQKITFGEMRESGVRDVLIYCRDHRCSHHVETNADGWTDSCAAVGYRAAFHRYTLRQKGRGRAAQVLAYAHGDWLGREQQKRAERHAGQQRRKQKGDCTQLKPLNHSRTCYSAPVTILHLIQP